MTEPEQYFRPRNWSKFQHYKSRRPPWIKLHISLLDDHDFAALTDLQRLTLLQLWLLYSRMGRPIPRDPGWIARQLQANPSGIAKTLKALISSNFIELCDRRASMVQSSVSDHAPLETETETETERKKEQPHDANASPSPSTAEAKSDGKAQAPRGTRLDPDWRPGEPGRAAAAERGFSDPEIDDHAERFRNHFVAGPGRAKTWTDWHRAWINWLARETPIPGPGHRGNGAGGDRSGDGGVVAAVNRIIGQGKAL